MSMVIFQYLIDLNFILSLGVIGFGYFKKRKNILKIGVLYLIILVTLKSVIYYNYTGSDKRIKEEAKQSTMVFQSKMKEPEEHIKQFNYSKEFKDTSSSITQEADEIHDNIKK